MQKLIRITAMLLIVMLSVVAVRVPNAVAQDDELGPLDDPSQFEGLEEAVGRTYSVEVGRDSTGAYAYVEGFAAMATIVFKFDTDSHAKEGLVKVEEQIDAEGFEGLELEEVVVDGLNDDSIAWTTTTELPVLGLSVITVVATQEEDYLYMAWALAKGTDTDVDGIVGDLVLQIIDGDAGVGDPTFNANGTSEGGLWDKFPDADNDLVKDLIPTDEQIFPVPAE